MARLALLAAAAVLAAAPSLANPSLATPSGGRAGGLACGASPYSYAGLLAAEARNGVAATIRPMGVPALRAGHVAAWVGVGGEGLGPDGADEWLQTGISVEPDIGAALYYELTLPGRATRYVMLEGHLRLDRSYRVAVLESRTSRGSWTVWVDGTRVSRTIHLPGSHGAWRPVATTESWNGDVGACNRFAFAFRDVAVATRPGGAWAPMTAQVLDAPGYSVVKRTPASFVALGGI
jgi:hypothetical protein